MKTLLRFSTYCTLLWLTACAGIGTPMSPETWQADNGKLTNFSTSGRLAVKSELNKGSYASFDWERSRHSQIISINTPLGNTVGQLCRDAQGVIAQNARGEIFQAADSETLSRQLTGFTVPLDHLDIWALGRYQPQLPHQILPNGNLQQAGWLIHRELADTGGAPRNLTLNRDNLIIRLVFDTFTENTPDTVTQCPQRKVQQITSQ